jgi:hypothetical protein
VANGGVNELEQYVFVLRVRVGECGNRQWLLFIIMKAADKTTKDPTSYIDIKSELLRDILREILQDVRGITLAEDMPTVLQM